MDRQIKKRMRPILEVFPYTGTVDGDKEYGTSYTLSCFVVPIYKIVTNREGVEVQTKTTIILDAKSMGAISDKDEVSLPYIGRCPILSITPYYDLKQDFELIEVFI